MNETEIILNWGLNNLSPSIIISGIIIFSFGRAIKKVINCLMMRFDRWYVRVEQLSKNKDERINNLENKYIQISLSMSNYTKELTEVVKVSKELSVENNKILKDIKNAIYYGFKQQSNNVKSKCNIAQKNNNINNKE